MDPEKFLGFAEAIEQSNQFIIDEETDCRTGIGRAQYSIFLELRAEIGKKLRSINSSLANKYQNLITGKVKKRERSKIHGIIPAILSICDPTLRNQYRDLREERNVADYNMIRKITKRDLKRANQLARHLKSRIIIIIQAYLHKSQIISIFSRYSL